MSAPDTINSFIETMALEGVKPAEPIAGRLATGQLIRFRCDGDGHGRQNGWAVLYLDGRPAGAFGNYRLGLRRKWKSGDNRQLTSAERNALRREWADAKRRRLEERQRVQAAVAKNAQATWRNAGTASASHPYVIAKNLDPSPLRQLGGTLLIPMQHSDGQIWNLQGIAGDGSKRFLRGGRTEGLGCLIGHNSTSPEIYCVAEGYATAAAVHRATGHPCVVAFSAHNLAPLARIFRGMRPDIDLIVCADSDGHLQVNVGLRAARAAASEVGAKLALPPMNGDFHDVAKTLGLRAVSEAIRAAR